VKGGHQPVVSVRSTASIEEAARLIAETGYHRLPVIDETGSAVGVVSALDVLRGMIGVPAPHPAQFPHYDAEHGLVWTDDVPLEPERVDSAPDAPGVLLLVAGGAGMTDHVVWAEAARNLRRRLIDLVSLPQTGKPDLVRVLERPTLRFRAAAVHDPDRATAIARAMGREAKGPGFPAGAEAIGAS
jgi:hypothetical protein